MTADATADTVGVGSALGEADAVAVAVTVGVGDGDGGGGGGKPGGSDTVMLTVALASAGATPNQWV